jgi:hypothetical protein
VDIYTAIRIRAFRAVQAPDKDYLIRKVLRWFSKTFHTPIERVEELPLDDVMQAYYEDKYENMSPDELDAERQELITTDEQRYERILAEEANDAEMFEMARMIAAEEAAKKTSKVTDTKPDAKGVITPVRHPVPGLLKQVRKAAEAELPDGPPPETLPSGIKMSFIEDSDLEAEIAKFEAMADGKKP